MEILITVIILTIWVISVIIVINIYCNKDIDLDFWPVLGLIVPIINTIIAIKYGSIDWIFDSLKKFIKELNKN